MSELKFEDSAIEAINLVEESSTHLFITGVAGTGKSTLVRHILSVTKKPAIVVAPTGIAATNIGGSTIHSMFGIPIGMYLHDVEVSGMDYDAFMRADLHKKANKLSRAKKTAIKKAKLVVIDEVSMLRADLLDAMEQMMRIVRNSKKPFGGLQILFVGDMMQLPPVLCNYEMPIFNKQYESEFFFDATCINVKQVKRIELTQIHRQIDPDFIRILNNLRRSKLDMEDLCDLNQKVVSGGISPELGVYITSHNYKADVINSRMVDKIKTTPFVHVAEVDGFFNPKNCLAPEQLLLKNGMRVMTLINNGSEYFNGKIGTIVNEPERQVVVKFDDGDQATITKHTWETVTMEYDGIRDRMKRVVSGTFSQFPLKPAYAITVHKSQGLSFDKAILDINEVFAAGQAYTALSRLRSMTGLTLLTSISPDVQIKMNDRLIDFINNKGV